jgi:hypothetical protein
MTKVQAGVVTAVALVVLLIGAVWLLGTVSQARSPEAKCRQVMADVERERAPATIAPDIWLNVYNDCVSRERGG